MEAKELRIGNYVTDEFYDSFKTIIEVDSISDRGINLGVEDDGNYPECAQTWVGCDYEFKELHGIPLTEEWLLKFGFKKVNDNHFFLEVLNRSRIHCYLREHNEVDIELGNKSGYSFGYPKVKNIHQLQNLYFALTGKELEINSYI